MEEHTVYISGPMTGIKDFNYPAFHAAEARLLSRGVKACINPAVTGEEDTKFLLRPIAWHDYMISAIDQMRHATAIHQMTRWWKSYGAWIEFIVALKMKLPRV